jgi:hypothetical protein
MLENRSQSLQWNMEGLRAMIVEKGGLQTLGKEASDGCGSWLLQRAISWYYILDVIPLRMHILILK